MYLFPYLKVLNENVTDLFYSCIVGVFPMGIALSSPISGFWFNRVSTRLPIAFGLLLLVCSNLLYSCCGMFPPELAIWMVLVSMILMAISTSNKIVITSYVTAATSVKDRTGIMSNLFLSLPASIVLGPTLGMLFLPLGYPGYSIPYINVSFNMYTAPSFLIALLAIVNLVLLLWFKEFFVTPLTSRKKCYSCSSESQELDPLINSESSTEETKIQNPPYDKVPLIYLGFSAFLSHMLVAAVDSLISPYSMDEFAWTKQTTIYYDNIIMIVSGVVSFISIILIKKLLKYISERMLYILCYVILSLVFLIYIPWPGPIPEPIHPIAQLTANKTVEWVGCDYRIQHWCLTVPKIHEFQLFLAPVLFLLSFPIIYLLTVTMASKIIGPHPPGVVLGIIGFFASIGRAIGSPILIQLYFRYGPQIVSAAMEALVGTVIILTVVMYHRLVPYSAPRRCF